MVRFAAELGFEGYPQLQKAMQELIRSKLTSVQRVEVTRARMGDSEVLDNVMAYDMQNIRQTLEELPRGCVRPGGGRAGKRPQGLYFRGGRRARQSRRIISSSSCPTSIWCIPPARPRSSRAHPYQ